MGTRESKGRDGERDRVRVKKPGDVILLARVILSPQTRSKSFHRGSAPRPQRRVPEVAPPHKLALSCYSNTTSDRATGKVPVQRRSWDHVRLHQLERRALRRAKTVSEAIEKVIFALSPRGRI